MTAKQLCAGCAKGYGEEWDKLGVAEWQQLKSTFGIHKFKLGCASRHSAKSPGGLASSARCRPRMEAVA